MNDTEENEPLEKPETPSQRRVRELEEENNRLKATPAWRSKKSITWALVILAVIALVIIGVRSGFTISNTSSNDISQQQAFDAQLEQFKAELAAKEEAHKREVEENARQLAAFKAEQAEKELRQQKEKDEAAAKATAEAALKAIDEQKAELLALREELKGNATTASVSTTLNGTQPVLGTPVQTPPATAVGGYQPIVTLADWETKFKTLNQEVFVEGDEKFRAMNPHMSPREVIPGHPNGVSYVLVTLPGENKERLWRSNTQPPLQLPSGTTKWGTDENGHWYAE